jgi:hypothetical protein
MTTATSFAKLLLAHLGIDVQAIETSNEERADFLARIGDAVTLVEEKTKLEDPGAEAVRQEALREGKVHPTHIPIKPDNRLSGINRKASKQLASSASTFAHDFRLVWFTATGNGCLGKQQQFIATIYGTSGIVELDNSQYRACYFFRNSDFFRFRENLDGAVAAYSDGKELSATLCLNPLSPRYVEFKASPFVKAFGTAVRDPVTDEKEGRAFIVDRDIDRKNQNSVLEFLQQKYSTKPLMSMDMGYSSISVQVSKQDG